jgi:hypothetical protein
MLKRKQPTEEPIWPVCSLGTDSANRDVHDRICLPLALAVTRGIVDPDAVTRVVKRSFEKGKVADADKEAEAALHGCLQRFHVTLAMMWSMAVAVNHDRDFQVMTSLEILLAASLLNKIRLPPAFAEDLFCFLFTTVKLLGSEEGQAPSASRPDTAVAVDDSESDDETIHQEEAKQEAGGDEEGHNSGAGDSD